VGSDIDAAALRRTIDDAVVNARGPMVEFLS
jgi:hypothetical protein